VSAEARRVALAGNPNVGKTSLFNALTGARYHVGNYPGVTVEVRSGHVARGHGPRATLEIVDLPGIYSLTPLSDDEEVAFHALADAGGLRPDVLLLVLDAGNLARNLYFALQLAELGVPMVAALNMMDVARAAGVEIAPAQLEAALGIPVIATVARTGEGIPELVAALDRALEGPATQPAPAPLSAPPALVERLQVVTSAARARALPGCFVAGAADRVRVTAAERELLEAAGLATCRAAAQALVFERYARVDAILARLGIRDAHTTAAPVMDLSRRIDGVLTHPVLGWGCFLAIMIALFQSIFSWAEPVMELIEAGAGLAARVVARALGPGLLTDLVTQGVIAGVGNVVTFLPQIALLFLFLGLLEDTGYLARAAFVMDRLMARVGLHGRAFVPLLSGYACAIPAILGTRTISTLRDRVVAMLMIPYMSCSARLPIYLLVVYALYDADRPVLGPLTEGSLVVLGMYALSTASALLAGVVLRRTILRGPTPPLVLELPPYRVPRLRNTLLLVWDRSLDFLRNAGTMILACTIVLWGLLSFPRDEVAVPGQPPQITHSYGARAVQTLEPALAPMGQDWRIGVGIVGSFAAREVLVSTLGLVYGMEASDDDDRSLRQALREDRDEAGRPRHTRLSGLALMVFFVYACQCMSTLAVVRRETRGWRWPAFMFVSMTTIAWLAATLVFQVGRALGAG
jgi:ferrous iron transport protein B